MMDESYETDIEMKVIVFLGAVASAISCYVVFFIL
jgi:hypothetical protein